MLSETGQQIRHPGGAAETAQSRLTNILPPRLVCAGVINHHHWCLVKRNLTCRSDMPERPVSSTRSDVDAAAFPPEACDQERIAPGYGPTLTYKARSDGTPTFKDQDADRRAGAGNASLSGFWKALRGHSANGRPETTPGDRVPRWRLESVAMRWATSVVWCRWGGNSLTLHDASLVHPSAPECIWAPPPTTCTSTSTSRIIAPCITGAGRLNWGCSAGCRPSLDLPNAHAPTDLPLSNMRVRGPSQQLTASTAAPCTRRSKPSLRGEAQLSRTVALCEQSLRRTITAHPSILYTQDLDASRVRLCSSRPTCTARIFVAP
ncbi:hypothetical protein CC80DRAFT_546861 [Byssothecium circinans]|uniref:Uncharacterized protein n=1 Tax=Byssothecium circinans TaxID=147558 RepID=A0A6A5U1T3_9PLEO|nr:hypothetical protein CC80DRAFT_546861 [Byssothecium circinans]